MPPFPYPFGEVGMLSLTNLSCDVCTIVGDLSNILNGSFDIPSNFNFESRGLWECESEIQSTEAWKCSKSNDDSPHIIKILLILLNGFFEHPKYCHGYKGCCQYSKSLHCKDSTHHGSSVASVGEFRGNDS